MRVLVEIPESKLKSLAAFIEKIDGSIVDDGSFTPQQLDLIKRGVKEAKAIKSGNAPSSKPESYNYF